MIKDDIATIRNALQETANDTVFGTPEHERQLLAIEALDRLATKLERAKWIEAAIDVGFIGDKSVFTNITYGGGRKQGKTEAAKSSKLRLRWFKPKPFIEGIGSQTVLQQLITDKDGNEEWMDVPLFCEDEATRYIHIEY